MARMNKIRGYKVNGLFGEAERLINVGNAIDTISEEFAVDARKIVRFIKQENFVIKTLSREKMSFGNEGSELFTTEQEYNKLLEFIKSHIEEIKEITITTRQTRKVVIYDYATAETKEFKSQLDAVKYMGFARPGDVTLREGKHYRGGRFEVITKEQKDGERIRR